MTSYFRVGGLALEPPPGWLERVGTISGLRFRRTLTEYEDLLTQNRIWLARTKGIGCLSAEDAIALGVSGPTLRGSGVDYDIRKYFPYSSYEEFDFDVPVRTEGDVLRALSVPRGGDARERENRAGRRSRKIPAEGPIRTEAPGIIPPSREEMKTSIEGLIYHFKIYTEGFSPPPGEVYQAMESPRGELGFFVASDGSAQACTA